MIGVHLVRGHRVEDLCDSLCQALTEGCPDPVVSQVVVVGSRGMERWLRHRVATSLGICANVDFQFPGRAFSELMASALGKPLAGLDPYDPDSMVWHILKELTPVLDQPVFEMVREYLSDGAPHFDPQAPISARTWSWAREMADTFDRYTLYRPDWISCWAKGSQPTELLSDSAMAHSQWQAELWRRLESRLGPGHFASRLEQMRVLLSEVQVPQSNAPTIHVFGITALPPALVDVMGLLGRVMKVNLFVFSPSDLFWGDLRDRRRLRSDLRRANRVEVVRQIRADLDCQNPLLTSLGRRSRDFQLVLEEVACGYQERVATSASPDPNTLLTHIQDDIGQLRAPTQIDPPYDLDDSIQIHGCHGPLRQVEVLRQCLLGLFEADPSLQPRHVAVMTPDIDLYAPLVSTVFGRGRDRVEQHDGWGGAGSPRIPTQIADLGLRSLNPVADALLRVMELSEQRVTASRVLDLLSLKPVRDRFGFTEDDVKQSQRWIQQAGVRWGVDADDRQAEGQPSDPQNTWLFGMQRLVLGAVMADDGEVWSGIRPFDDMEGDRIEVMGQLVHFLRTLFAFRQQLRKPRDVGCWVTQLIGLVRAMTLTQGDSDWLTEQVVEGIEALGESVLTGQSGEVASREVEIGAIRRYLDGRFQVNSHGDRPISGAVAVCALAPMRSVPYRVICLVGMDDLVFPRAPRVRGFDLIQRHPRLGDRDVRDEDRHLFLEAVLSARDHLLIFYTGRDPRKNEARPPAGPVAELIDVVAASCRRHPTDENGRDGLVIQHPLQPFSASNFNNSDQPSSFSYDAGALGIAQSLAEPRDGSTALFCGTELSEWSKSTIAIHDLISFVRHPVRHLLNRRLGLYLREEGDEVADREPIELDGLERWSLKEVVFQEAITAYRRDPPTSGCLSSTVWSEIYSRVCAQGGLPLGSAGRAVFASLRPPIDRVIFLNREALARCWMTAEVKACVDDLTIHGTVDNLGDDGVLYDLKPEPYHSPKRLLTTWIRLLTLAVDGGHKVESAVIYGIYRKDGRWRPGGIRLNTPADPKKCLAGLVDLYREGMRRPLPMSEKTSYEFGLELWGQPDPWSSVSIHDMFKPLKVAASAWEGSFNGPPGERNDPHLSAVFPDVPPFRTIDDPDLEFVRLAEQIWRPILDGRAAL